MGTQVGKSICKLLRTEGYSIQSGEFSLGLRRTYGEEIRTIANIPKTGRRNSPVESSDSVLLNDPSEHLAGGHGCE